MSNADAIFVCPSCGKALGLEKTYGGYSISCCVDVDDHGQQTGPHASGWTPAECVESWIEMLEDLKWESTR